MIFPNTFRPKCISYILILLFLFSTHCLFAQFTKITGARGLDNSTGGNINGHAWGDVDDDGDLDVIFFSATSGSQAESKLFINSGAPSYTFTDATSTRIDGFNDDNNYGRQMLIADLNNDGYNDIVRGYGGNRNVEVYFNDGPPNYTFGLPTTQQPDVEIGAPGDGEEWNTEGIVAVDWNQDGWLDLIIDNDGGGNDVYENDQSGGFTYISPGTAVGQTGFPDDHTGDGDFMTAADIDNDGYVDLYGRKTAVTNYWYFNSTTSQFETQANPNIVSSESDKGGTMFCDFDNDGDLDLFWTSFGTNQIWRNDGGNVWTATGVPGAPVNSQSNIDGCDCGDFDNDGDNDIVLGAASGNSYLLENTTPVGGALSFTTNNIAVSANTESVTFVDFDNDGDLDLYFVVNGGANQLWQNSTNNTNYLYVNALMDLGGGQSREAIGANVFLTNCYGDTTTMRTVSGGKGHGSQHQTKLHFGVDPDLSYNVQVYYVYKNGSRSVVTQSVVPADEPNQEITILDTDSDDAFYCTDTDDDIVIDLLDIDDDNDGIPDVDERRICNTGTNVSIASFYMNSGEGNSPTSVDSDATVKDQTPGPGWDSWGIPGSGLELNSTTMPQDLNEAIAGDFYVEYTIQPGSGKAFDVTNLIWGWNDFTNTPKHTFKVSVYALTDNYTTPILQDITRPNDTDNYIWHDNSVSQPFISDVVDSIVFRVYLYEPAIGLGGTAITNGTIVWDDFSVGGYHAPLDDCDGDGIPNIHDLDSDNDGIYDGVEAGHGETLTNGVLTGTMGDNGLDDALETLADNGVLNYTLIDTDSDGRDNPYDFDSDEDGCPDAVEAGHTDANNDGELDGTGIDGNGLVTGAVSSFTGGTLAVTDQFDNTACCDVSKSGFADNDGDNYADDICDLDDDNDGITDLDELYCATGTSTSATFNSVTEAWQSTGAAITAGTVYSLSPSGSSLGSRVVTGGPNDGLDVSVIQFSSTRFADLDGYGYWYADNSLESLLRSPLPIGFASLTGTEYQYLLTFIGMIDVNGNGAYDAGVDQIIPRLFLENSSIRFTANVSGVFYIVFTDSNYGDNSGTFSFTVEECIPYDSDGDGVDDYLDNDSDNDGCFDAIEAAGNFSLAHVDVNGALTGGVDGDGIPSITSGSQATATDVTDEDDSSQCSCGRVMTNRHIFKRVLRN